MDDKIYQNWLEKSRPFLEKFCRENIKVDHLIFKDFRSRFDEIHTSLDINFLDINHQYKVSRDLIEKAYHFKNHQNTYSSSLRNLWYTCGI